MRKTYFILFGLLLISSTSFAQLENRISYEAIGHFGKVIKHNNRLLFDVPDPAWGTELSFRLQTLGKKQWQQFRNYPHIGISLLHFDFGNKAVLGNATGVYPNFTFFLSRRQKLDFNFKFGIGLVRHNKYFNPVSNPENNGIGSRINNITGARLSLAYHMTTQLDFRLGASFSHFSNGLYQSPNNGLNVIAAFAGLHFRPRTISKDAYISSDGILDKPVKRHGWNIYLGWGYKESAIARGPKYPVYMLSIGRNYYLNKFNRLVYGFEYEYQTEIYRFGQHVQQFADGKRPFIQSSRAMVFLGDEFLFGHVSIRFQTGLYLGTRNNYFLLPFPLYNKLSAKFFIPILQDRHQRYYVGVQMKSHIVSAEYMGIFIGTTF